jgi:hypothetical protein
LDRFQHQFAGCTYHALERDLTAQRLAAKEISHGVIDE